MEGTAKRKAFWFSVESEPLKYPVPLGLPVEVVGRCAEDVVRPMRRPCRLNLSQLVSSKWH